MGVFWDTLERPNLQVVGIEGEEQHAKNIENTFNRIIEKTIQNLEKEIPGRYKMPIKHQLDCT